MGTGFWPAILLLLLSLSARADVVNPGHINRSFQFTNLDKFPAFSYYFLHYDYHYDMGYNAGPVDTAKVENNQRYAVSDKGNNKSALLARDKKGKYYTSDIRLGGAAIVGPTISGIVDVYTITGIKNGKISIKKQKEIIIYTDGKEKEHKAGSGWIGLGSDDFTNGLTLISTGALLAMLLIFILKRRKPKYIQLAT